MVSNELGKASFKETMSQAATGRIGCLSWGGLRVLSADLGTGWGLEGFRADSGLVVEGKMGI